MRPSFLVFLWPHFFQSLMTVSRLRERKKKCDKMFFFASGREEGARDNWPNFIWPISLDCNQTLDNSPTHPFQCLSCGTNEDVSL